MAAGGGYLPPYWASAGGLELERSVEKEDILPGIFLYLSLEAQMGIGWMNKKEEGIPGHICTMSPSEMCRELSVS